MLEPPKKANFKFAPVVTVLLQGHKVVKRASGSITLTPIRDGEYLGIKKCWW